MRVSRPVVIGWFLLVAGGWAATLWLGEPSATAGPAPYSSVPSDNPVPGPQPEGGSCATPSAASSPSADADPLLLAKVPGEYRAEYAQGVYCVYITARDSARAR
ncbi:hypothetical protein OG488_23460 [Streptomyces sp. NBC_01460]|uniref:hypothetical protein n=1 Tax=Streptomyces sp. NBC_01460 TaxID=2903875 RepID=UPI002E2EBE9F|nr:hypothetical protein [Streptomyces sp. NBC_01460]